MSRPLVAWVPSRRRGASGSSLGTGPRVTFVMDPRPSTIENLTAELEQAAGARRADVLLELAGHFYSSDHAKAKAYAKGGLECAREAGHTRGELHCARLYAKLLMLDRRYEEATALLSEALVTARDLDDIRLLASVYEGLAGLHHLQGNRADAIDLIERALALSEGLPASKVADLQLLAGRAYLANREYATAITHLLAAELHFKKASFSFGVAQVRSILGTSYYEIGDLERSRKYLLSCLETARGEGNQIAIAIAATNLGQTSLGLDQVDEAERVLREAVQAAETIGYHDVVANSSRLLGAVQRRRDDPAGARALFVQAHALATRIGLAPVAHEAALDLGRLALEDGEPATARDSALQVLQECDGADLTPIQRAAHELAADSLEALGDHSAALAHMRTAAKAAREEAADRSRQLRELWLRHEVEAARADAALHRFKVLEREESRAAAAAVDAARCEAMARLSGELRTPLNRVLGTARLLLRSELNDRQREMLQAVRHSATELGKLLDDLVALASAEADEGGFEPVDESLKGG